jgi:hypothetical protein
MSAALNPVWWQPPKSMRPLEAIRITAECLEHGKAVPTQAADIVSHALRQYLDGQTDISRNLGLRPRRGGTHETPLRLEQATHRNDAIRAIYEAMPATSKTGRAEQTAKLLRSPPDQRITEADVFAHLVQLYESHAGTLPTSSRQVIRIINGDTVAERKK